MINGSNGDFNHYFVRVGDVSILRLKFKTDGVVYDLGVVDNKQSGSTDPAGESKEKEPWEIIIMLLSGIMIVMVLVFLSPFISVLLKMLWDLFALF